MNQENKKIFWIFCFIAVILGTYWSAMAVMRQSRPLFIAFLAINIVALIAVVACLLFDVRKNKTRK